jgi:hypothetical protein
MAGSNATSLLAAQAEVASSQKAELSSQTGSLLFKGRGFTERTAPAENPGRLF